MKQFLAITALNEAVERHCDTCRDVKIRTEGFKAVQYEAMEFSVTCDGEPYQPEKLYEELRQVGFPGSSSLEEAVLYAYLLWDEKAVEHMEGAYSFVIRKGNSLFCAKDPLGLRPTYYLIKGNCIWINCRIRPLLDASDTPAVLNRRGLLEPSALDPSISENQTLYRDVHVLPMGSLLRISAGKLGIETCYKLSAHPHADTSQETITEVHDLMSASIHAQASGAQTGFLSGGLDSGLITSIATKKNPQQRTYSLDYEGDKEGFERNIYQASLGASFIQDICESRQCERTLLMLSQQKLCDLLEDTMPAREAPGMAGVDSSLLWLCRKVAEEEQIILSGECSDGIFGDCPWFYRDELKDLDTFPRLHSTKKRISLLHPDLQSLPYEDHIARRYAESAQDIECLDTSSDEDRRVCIHTVLCPHWFMQMLVTRQVCMGDAAHLDIRAPFASVRLLEYVYNIPWEMKFLRQEEKGILRRVFEYELPESVAHRKKNLFLKIHNSRYAGLINKRPRERYEDPTSLLHGLFGDVKLKELIDAEGGSFQLPQYGQLMSGPQLFTYLYQTDRWIVTKHISIEK